MIDYADYNVIEFANKLKRMDPETELLRDTTPGGGGRAMMRGKNWHCYFDGTLDDMVVSLTRRKANLERIADEMDAPMIPDPSFPYDIRDSAARLGVILEEAKREQDLAKSPVANKIRDLKARHNQLSPWPMREQRDGMDR